MGRRRNFVIGLLLITVVAMSIGYAALSQVLNIEFTASTGGSKWKVELTEAKENTMNNAETVGSPIVNFTTASFEVTLKEPGAKAVYDVTVANRGTINAVLDSITGLEEANDKDPQDIKFSVTGINVNDKLPNASESTFQVTVEWISESTEIPTESKTATISLNYIQDVS